VYPEYTTRVIPPHIYVSPAQPWTPPRHEVTMQAPAPAPAPAPERTNGARYSYANCRRRQDCRRRQEGARRTQVCATAPWALRHPERQADDAGGVVVAVRQAPAHPLPLWHRDHPTKVLAQPVCASAAERNWSIYGKIKPKERSQLGHAKSDKLVYCHEALHLQDACTCRTPLTQGAGGEVGLRLRLGRERGRGGPDGLEAGVASRRAVSAGGARRESGDGELRAQRTYIMCSCIRDVFTGTGAAEIRIVSRIWLVSECK